MNIRSKVAGTLLAASVVAGGVFLASNEDTQPHSLMTLAEDTLPRLPNPAVFISTLTLPSKDSVGMLVGWTRRCTAQNVCPVQWRLAWRIEQDSATARVRTGLKDTIRIAKSVCPVVYNFNVAVVADPSTQGDTTTARSSHTIVGMLGTPCRQPTAAELAERAAEADSFPKSGRRIRLATNWMRSASNPNDSILTQQTYGEDGIVVPLGYTMGPLCILKRNRYNGNVWVDHADPLAKCEAVRLQYEREQSG